MPKVKAPKQEPKLPNQSYTVRTTLGFPHKRRGGLFQLFRMLPWGWEDLGETSGRDGNAYFCALCKEVTHVGSEEVIGEERELFRFCPRCMIKTFVYKK